MQNSLKTVVKGVESQFSHRICIVRAILSLGKYSQVKSTSEDDPISHIILDLPELAHTHVSAFEQPVALQKSEIGGGSAN